MPNSPPHSTEEWITIQVAIALDAEEAPETVAKRLGVPLPQVKRIQQLMEPQSEGEVLQTDSSRKQGGVRLQEGERALLVAQVAEGRSLKTVAETAGVNPNTLRLWCRKSGVEPLREVSQLSRREAEEIRELLESGELPQEVSHAYRLSTEAVEELREPLHRQLEPEVLACLLELMKEAPKASTTHFQQELLGLGMEASAEAIESYRRRLKRLGRL